MMLWLIMAIIEKLLRLDFSSFCENNPHLASQIQPPRWGGIFLKSQLARRATSPQGKDFYHIFI